MQFDDTAIEQAAQMTTSLIEGEGLLFRLDVQSEESVDELVVMITLGAAPHRLASGLAVPFFLVEPSAIGATSTDERSWALVGPGLTNGDDLGDDLGHAPPGAVLAGFVLAGDQERLQTVAVTKSITSGFIAATPTKLLRFTPDEDDALFIAAKSAIGTHSGS